jgi:hypothetical protein
MRGLLKVWKNLRFRLVVLVLITIIPGLILNLVLAQNLRSSTADRFVDQAELVANTVTIFQRERVTEIRDLLEGLSTDPLIRNFDENRVDECVAYMGGILSQHPQYANLGMFDANGITLCNGRGTAPGNDNSDRSYY